MPVELDSRLWWSRAVTAGSLALLGAIASCHPPGETPGGLEAVERPADLDHLDLAVREQFEATWKELREGGGEARRPPGSAAAWGALGQWFEVYGYSESAGRCYRNARRLDPGEPRWPYYLGVLAENAGDLAAARELYSAVVEMVPGEVAPRVRLGDLALQQNDLDRAEALYRQVLAVQPENPGALLGSGRVALLRGDAEAALGPLETLARSQPEAVEVLYSLGLAWRRLGDDERADEELRQVPEDNLDQISLTRDSPWDRELRLLDRGARTLTRRGVRALDRGETERAAVLLGRAVVADPDGPEKRINYALALLRTGRRSAAAAQLEEALRLADGGSELAAKAHLELGRLLAAEGRPAAASHLEAALAIDPRSVTAHVQLARLRHRQGRLEEALDHYAAARAIDPSLTGVRFWQAVELTLLGRHSDAVESLADDLRELGGQRRPTLLLARLLAAAPEGRLRDASRAQRLLATATGPPDVLFAETRAMVAAERGRFTEAVAWQSAAVSALDGRRPRTAAQRARRRLVLYRGGEPCRNPWEMTEVPLSVPVAAL